MTFDEAFARAEFGQWFQERTGINPKHAPNARRAMREFVRGKVIKMSVTTKVEKVGKHKSKVQNVDLVCYTIKKK